MRVSLVPPIIHGSSVTVSSRKPVLFYIFLAAPLTLFVDSDPPSHLAGWGFASQGAQCCLNNDMLEFVLEARLSSAMLVDGSTEACRAGSGLFIASTSPRLPHRQAHPYCDHQSPKATHSHRQTLAAGRPISGASKGTRRLRRNKGGVVGSRQSV